MCVSFTGIVWVGFAVWGFAENDGTGLDGWGICQRVRTVEQTSLSIPKPLAFLLPGDGDRMDMTCLPACAFCGVVADCLCLAMFALPHPQSSLSSSILYLSLCQAWPYLPHLPHCLHFLLCLPYLAAHTPHTTRPLFAPPVSLLLS